MSVLIAAAVVIAVVLAAVMRARHSVARLLVARSSLMQDGLGRHFWLRRRVARNALPVRLVGVGGPAQRLSTALINERPNLDICGTPARALAPLTGQTTYLLIHPIWIEIWARTGPLSVRRAVALEREALHKEFELILHDPDGIGAIDSRYRKSIGTIEISVTERLHLFFEVLIKPRAPRPGAGSTHEHGFA